MPGAVQVVVRPDRVAVLTLDQPGSRANILTPELWIDFETVLRGLEANLAGLVVASGKPGAFIAGADLKYLANVPAPNDKGVRALIELGLRVLDLLDKLPFPTCAAIDGPALGGGLEVALACDYRIAGSNSKIELGLPEVKLGLIPGWGGTQRLPRIVGMKAAADLLGSGQGLSPSAARKIGLLEASVDSDRLLDAAAELVLSKSTKREHGSFDSQTTLPIIPHEPTAVREAIQCLVSSSKVSFETAIRIETTAFLRLAGSDESKQRIAAFFANRKRS